MSLNCPKYNVRMTERQNHTDKIIACLCLCSLLACGSASAAEPCANPEYTHGISHLLPMKYKQDFEHFEYTNPDAPKAGAMRVPQMGTFDNFNSVIEKGRLAAGYEITAGLVYDRLLEPSIDEPVAQYGRLAQGVDIGPDLAWVAFKLRPEARWHDGKPITAEDVVFTYETFKQHGSIALKTAIADIERVFQFGEGEVCFVRKTGIELNHTLPFTIGNFSILPKHYWQEHDITRTTIDPPLASGPYQLKRSEIGRVVSYQRYDDYWGKDLPVNKGRHNFEEVKFDYFKDENVMGEAHKGNVFDVREEGVSKNWATYYDFPAVHAGLFIKDLRPLNRVEGLWWPIFWNVEKPNLQDIRVREALWLLFDFAWTNRVLFYDFYNTGISFFQNSPMAHQGLPGEKELALLEPWRDQLPSRVFTEPFANPPSTGVGPQRQNIKRAIALFKEAGWEVQDGVMRSVSTGEAFTLDIIGVSYYSVRQALSLRQNLRKVGIESNAVAPEVSNWLFRSRSGKFDGNTVRLGPSNTPGIQLRNWFGSEAAGEDYGQNWMRVRNPAIDALIDAVNEANTAEDLYAATRALDRVIMWNFYFIPLGSQPGFRLVHWDKFGEIKSDKLNRVPFIDAWWWDEEKAARVEAGLAQLEAED
jgi:microcin C transport system substrate-binding protein